MRADRAADRREADHHVVDAPARQEVETRRAARATSASHLSTSCTSRVQSRCGSVAKSASAKRTVAQLPAIAPRLVDHDARQRDLLAGEAGEIVRRERIDEIRRTRRGPAAAASASSRAGIAPAACRAAACASRDRLSIGGACIAHVRSSRASFAGQAGVARRRHRQQALLRIGRQRRALPMNALQRLARDALAARQLLQLLVRVRQAVAAHHGLHRLRPALPSSRRGRRRARSGSTFELAQAAQQRVVARAACSRSAMPRLRSTVESVRSRCQRLIGSFSREVREQRIGEAEVAFGVLEVDRVDLVRHRRRADFAGLQRLLEVAQRDVAPDVAARGRSGSCWRARIASNSSAMQSCGSIWVVYGLKSRPSALDEAAARTPASRCPDRRRRARCSCRPRRSSCRAARRAAMLLALALRGARRRWRFPCRAWSAMAVWPCVRDSIGSAACACAMLAQRGDERVERRQQHVVARVAQHQRVGEVVDVLAGAGEVDELGGAPQLGVAVELLLDASTRPP